MKMKMYKPNMVEMLIITTQIGEFQCNRYKGNLNSSDVDNIPAKGQELVVVEVLSQP